MTEFLKTAGIIALLVISVPFMAVGFVLRFVWHTARAGGERYQRFIDWLYE